MEAFWKQVIDSKEGEEGWWCYCEVRKRYGVGLWKAITKDWDILSDSITFSVGNGRRARFWKEKWCDDELLCTSFPSLFAIASSKAAWVEDVLNHLAEGRVWSPYFCR